MRKAISNGAPDRRALVFLRRGPLVRRDGGWRFGTAKVGDGVVDRLVAAGKVTNDGASVTLCEIAP
jgi:hypothetical protein